MRNKSINSSYVMYGVQKRFIRFSNKRYYCSSPRAENVKSFELMPGLKALPIIGSLHHFLPVIGSIGIQPNFADLASVLYKKFGTIVKVEGIFSRATMVFLFEPEHYDQVYRAEEINPLRPGFEAFEYYREEIRKSRFNGVYGLTTAQGAKWRDFRTKVNPPMLKPKVIKLYSLALDEIAKEMVARFLKLKENNNYMQQEFATEMSKWAFESIALIGLGTRIGSLKDDITEDHPARQLMKCSKDILDISFKLEFMPSPWRYIPTPAYKKLVKTLDLQWELSEMYINIAKKKISKRGQDVSEEDKSIIEKLLAVDERVAVMMANEMLMAGTDTMSFVTTGLLYLLATNPEIQEKVRNEIRSGEPNKRYLKACLKEALRIWPVVSANLRRTSKEHVVGGYRIPEGVDVIAPNEFLSKLETNYPRPHEFIPERWLAKKNDPLYYGHAHPMVTLPFGFGVRSCIGRRIAELSIEVFISRLLQELKVTWDGPPIKVVMSVINNFVKPYHFKFSKLEN